MTGRHKTQTIFWNLGVRLDVPQGLTFEKNAFFGAKYYLLCILFVSSQNISKI